MQLNSNGLTYFANREDKIFVQKYSKRKTFHLGSNSLCHQHIQIHYKEYQQCCAEGNIPENDHVVPHKNLERQKQVKVGMAVGGKTTWMVCFPRVTVCMHSQGR